MINTLHAQLNADSLHRLDSVIVDDFKNKNLFTQITPTQQLYRTTLQNLNTFSVGEAAKYFSGVLIKDYGGIGGLKTISVRSLGAQQTGILYDGLPVSDMQSGQVDLSKIPTTFLQRISIDDAANFSALLPARTFGYASLMEINTVAYYPFLKKQQWEFGINKGSFGLWQANGGITQRINSTTFINATAEATSAKGNYPFYITNGNLSEKSRRDNSKVSSLNTEVNITFVFKDSSIWKTKAAYYNSKRGLPGAIVFFNDRSVQQLWNNTAYVQSTFNKQLTYKTALLLSAKYSCDYTRYVDPDFLNNEGGLDQQYHQNEWYGSAAVKHAFTKTILVSFASDVDYTTLTGNRPAFATPSRLSLWDAASVDFSYKLFKANANLLYTHTHEQVKIGLATTDKNELTPAIALSYKMHAASPLMLRFFYKRIFRLPTFNDLYYALVGNINLKPEYANQYNAGISYTKYISQKLNNLSFSVDGYYNTVTDKIVAIPNKNLFVWSMLNVGKVHITGIDVNAESAGNLSASWNWFFKAAYTYQHAIDVTNPSNETYKDQLPYTPVHSGSAIAQLQYSTWSFAYSNLYSGSRYSLGDNNSANYLKGWMTHDVSLSKTISIHQTSVSLKAMVSNFTNKHYDVVKYYPMPGRSYKINVFISKK